MKRTGRTLPFLAPSVVDGGRPGISYSISGASAAENRSIVDGLDTTDPGLGLLNLPMPMEFLQEVDIKTGAFEPRYGGAMGGIINMVSRSGSNELHGDGFAYYKDDSMKAAEPVSVRNDRFKGFAESELGFDLGGRIVADRLWYFVGANAVAGEEDWITSTQRPVTFDEDGLRYIAKLDWQIGAQHRLAATAFGDPSESTIGARQVTGVLIDTWDRERGHFAGSYNGVLSDSLFLEAFAGRFREEIWTRPFESRPVYTDASGGDFARQQNCDDPGPITGSVSSRRDASVGTSSGTLEDRHEKSYEQRLTFSPRQVLSTMRSTSAPAVERSSFSTPATPPEAGPVPFSTAPISWSTPADWRANIGCCLSPSSF